MNTTCSSGSRWSLVWAKKSANFWAFIPSSYRRVKNKASSWKNGERDSQISSSLPTDLPICSFSSYRSALASSYSYVVTTFVDENCVAYDSLAHEPVGVAMTFLSHLRAAPFCRLTSIYEIAFHLELLPQYDHESSVFAEGVVLALGLFVPKLTYSCRSKCRSGSLSFRCENEHCWHLHVVFQRFDLHRGNTLLPCYDTSSSWPVYTNGICYHQIIFVRIRFKCPDIPFSLFKQNTISSWYLPSTTKRYTTLLR